MAKYVDAFVIPILTKNVQAYRRIAKKAGQIWREHGAIGYMECVGDDLRTDGVPFPQMAKTRPGETVIFAWIVYKSRAHRNQVNSKVMNDPRMDRIMKDVKTPFDPKRMADGGFTTLVDLG